MKIDAPERDYLYIQPSLLPNAGKGLFTAIDIYKDEIIAEFKGELLSHDEAKRRADASQDAYFISLLDGTTLDSMHTICYAKYANDAKGTATSTIKNNAKIGLDDHGKVCIIATRKIDSGDEIRVAYGKKYWANFDKKMSN